MAISTLQVDENNDLFLPNGRSINVLSGADACVQDMRQACLMRLKENPYSQTDGVDFLGVIFAAQRDYGAARRSLSIAILSVPDTISIDSLDITIDGDIFNYEAKVVTIYGLLLVSK